MRASFNTSRWTVPARAAGVGAAATALALAGAADAATTGFDGQSEGFYGYTATFDGVTFQNAESAGDPRTYSIDDATQLWQSWGVTSWVSGQTLGLGAYSGGDDAVTFSATSQIEMTSAGVETYGAFTFFYILTDGKTNDYTQNTMTFEALLNGAVVSSTTVNPGNQLYDSGRATYGATRFEIDGTPFDTLRLTCAGPANAGRVVGVFDNVVLVPTPAGAALFALAGLAGARRRR